MRKLTHTLLAGLFLGTTVIASTAPVLAGPKQDREIERYYQKHARDDGYWRWQKNRNRWRDDDYRVWYREHHHGFGGDNAAAAVFGFAAGALVGAAATAAQPVVVQQPVVVGGGSDWLAYCSQRYRSFDPASGTYLGFDGQRHACVAP